ncbi:YdcF family protein [Clostridium perfringens]|nr:YdcF family protein [Clostridium perfringens]
MKKSVLKFISILIGVIFIAYYFLVNTLTGKTTFSFFYLIVGIGIIAYVLLRDKLLKLNWFKRIYKPFKILAIICVSIFIIVEGAIIFYPKKSLNTCDYIIVLGAGIRGESLTTTLKDRLDKTLEYLNKTGYDGEIIVSGGQGPGETITEAEAMTKYLIEKGIPQNRIILENKATSTYENLKYSKEIIENLSGKPIKDLNILVITTDFHAMRSELLAKRNGYGNVELYTSNSQWYLVPSMYAREFFAVCKSLVFDTAI